MLKRLSVKFSVFVIVAAVTATTNVHISHARVFAPGTFCDQPNDARVSNICGFARSATSQTFLLDNGDTAVGPSRGLGGVSVYLYECDPTSPTCKDEGNLTLEKNAFASTYTTDDTGWYQITTRKVGRRHDGNYRYIVWACNGKIAGMQKIKSYQSMQLDPILNCPTYSVYTPPPAKLTNIDANPLSCDMEPAIVDGPVAMEVSYSEENPKALLNLDTTVKDADGRFTLPEAEPLINNSGAEYGWLLSIGNLNGPEKGAWWSKDCVIKYYGDPNISLCMGSEESPGTTIAQTVAEYKKALYTRPEYLTQNKLPNIPPTNSILFYKELTPRQDLVEYAQSATKPAQFLHTQFGNCVGNVFLRKFGQSVEEEVVDCEIFKECNAAIGDGDRNRQYASGPMSMLANPSIFAQRYEQDVDKDVVVCKKGPECSVRCDPGSLDHCAVMGHDCVRIGNIQPSWSTCALGEDNCNYQYDKTYFNPEFLYYYGLPATPSKYGIGFESTNDSYGSSISVDVIYKNAPGCNSGTNCEPWKPTKEAEGVPQKGGTFVTGTNPLANSNNSLFAPLAGLVDNTLSSSSYVLSYVLDRPFETEDDKKRYTTGSIVVDKDPETAHCLKSNVNPFNSKTKGRDFITNVLTESRNGGIYKNSDFTGVKDHWFDGAQIGLTSTGAAGEDTLSITDTSSTAKNKRMATSALYFTSPAIKRAQELKKYAAGGWWGIFGLNTLELAGRDFYDSVLTTSYGTGKVKATLPNVANAALDVVSSLVRGSNESKTFLDRNNAKAPEQPRDFVKADFSISEETFTKVFHLPSRYDSGWLEPSNWGPGDSCYPWNLMEVYGKCDTDKTEDALDHVSRTCRVDRCTKKQTVVTCKCTRSNGNTRGPYDCTDKVIDLDFGGNCAMAQFDKQYQNRLKCAVNQTSCMDKDGNISDECIKLSYSIEKPLGNILDTAKPQNCDNVTFPSCCDSSSANVRAHCEGCTKNVDRPHITPACQVSRAGPFVCAGSASVATDFQLQNQNINEDNGLYLDKMKVVDNMYKQLIHPFSVNKTYVAGADVSAKTSVVPSEQEAYVNNHEAKHKDITGFGSGAAAEYKQISAHPTNFSNTPQSNPITYYCNNDLGGSGLWSCPLQEVPDPEFIDINGLRTDGKYGYSTASLIETNNVFSQIPQKRDNKNTQNTFVFFPTFPFIKSYAASGGGDCSFNAGDSCKEALGISDTPLSDYMRHIVDAAAYKFQVPSVVIIEYLARIGKMTSWKYYWSVGGEQALFDGSSPWYGTLGDCDEVNAAEQGAYDLFQTGFNAGLDSGAYDALEELSKGRGKTANRCNFLDATYAVAALLKEGSGTESCGQWTYDIAKNQLYNLTWGSDRQGSFESDAWYDSGQGMSIWYSCR